MNFLPNPLYHTRSKPLFYPEIIDILWDSSGGQVIKLC